jgi:hypothetical protein
VNYNENLGKKTVKKNPNFGGMGTTDAH